MGERVGIVGIGLMGLGMALRLRERGHRVGVRDIDAARETLASAEGAIVHPSPAALAREADLVIVAVVDEAQTREVLFGVDGVAQGLAPGGTVMLCPTIAPQAVEDCANALAERGFGCLDAPMSGGPVRARAGTMSLMVAGAEPLRQRWQPLLQDLSSRLFHISPRPGDGARTKLVNNLLAAINLAGAAEALALAKTLGLDPAATLAVIEQSSGQSWIGSDRLQRALRGDAEVQAAMRLLAKDSALALAMAGAAGVQPAVGAAAADCFAAACAAGLEAQDDARLWAWLAAGRPARG